MNQPDDLAAFRARVYSIVQQVPAGCVTTYGQVAAMIPPPAGIEPSNYKRMRAQWVGRALRNTPDNLDVPWQRVINSQGQISLPPGSRGAAIQRMRLEAEGIEFDRAGRIDLDKFGWSGPDPDWLVEHDLLSTPPLGSAKPTQLSLFPD